MGDFYEAFDDEARELARILVVAITKRNSRIMAGIPYHSLE